MPSSVQIQLPVWGKSTTLGDSSNNSRFRYVGTDHRISPKHDARSGNGHLIKSICMPDPNFYSATEGAAAGLVRSRAAHPLVSLSLRATICPAHGFTRSDDRARVFNGVFTIRRAASRARWVEVYPERRVLQRLIMTVAVQRRANGEVRARSLVVARIAVGTGPRLAEPSAGVELTAYIEAFNLVPALRVGARAPSANASIVTITEQRPEAGAPQAVSAEAADDAVQG